ncbi:universal stress protein [Scytonema sp. UIC 10036]|uniref:universal stress protein n=1 Tax=Scytonema sp. UIC 10036 TaxID=2304196 RepID=UPI0012DAF15C|nr:universal stress protein [Scytonema sp. UIC 10036]MUG98562.1 universal stress protein [Scytonema sp. UIC 10036]
MFKKILIALDRSEIGKYVFEQGFGLAKMTGASLLLLHVLSNEEEGSPYIPVSTFQYYPAMWEQVSEFHQQEWDRWKNQSVEMLQALCAQANTANVNAEFRQIPGNPSRAICDLAKTWDADLIVIGRRGHSGLAELLLGSVSNYVLHHAPCSVYVVQLPFDEKATKVAKESVSASISS